MIYGNVAVFDWRDWVKGRKHSE